MHYKLAYVLIALLLLFTACQRDEQRVGQNWNDYIGKNVDTVLEQLRKDGIETSYDEERYSIDMFNYQEHRLKEIINGLEYDGILYFGSYEESGETVLQSCIRSYESDTNPKSEVIEKLQQTLNEIVKKYGEPDWVSQEVDLKNAFAEKEMILFMTWDSGMEYQIRNQSGKLVVNWQIMSEDHYARREYSG